MSGAAEAILEDLLKQAQITNSQLAAMLKQGANLSGTGSNANTNSATATLIKNFSIAGLAVSAIAVPFNFLSNVVGGTVSKFTHLGTAAAMGTAKLSDFYKAFENIPIIGKLFDIFGQIVAYQEDLLKSYQDLTKSGASFSGNLYEMRQMAYQAYMTLDEFGKVVRDNSSLFATSIGGVDTGLKTFANTQRKLVDPSTDMGRSLAGLGVTATEAAEMLGTFMRMQGNMGRLNKMGSDAMAESTKGLIVQLDAYSKLTGESRETMEKQLKDRAFDEQKKMFLEALNPTERAQAEAALTAAAQMGGKGLEDEVAVRLMSNNQIKIAGTEAANSLRVTTRNASATAADVLAGLKDLKPGSDEAVAALQTARGSIATGTSQFNQAVGGAGRAGILSFFGALKFSTEQAKTYNQTMAQIEGSQLSDEEKRKEIFELQKRQYEGNAAALQAAQLQIRMFGSQLGASFLTLISKFSPAIERISKSLLDGFGGVVKRLTEDGGAFDKVGKFLEEQFVPVIKNVVDWFEDTFNYLSSSQDKEQFWSRLGEKLKEGASNIWEAVKPPLQALWIEAKPIILDGFKSIWEAIKDFFFGTKINESNRAEYQRQDEINKSVMTMGERASTFLMEGLESFVGLFSSDFAKRMAGSRIESQTESGIELKRLKSGAVGSAVPSRAAGSLGVTGNLFENWGSGTPAMLHGTEAVVTPAQMDAIVNNSVAAGLETLNIQVAELIRSNKEIADYARRNVDATRSLNGDLFAT